MPNPRSLSLPINAYQFAWVINDTALKYDLDPLLVHAIIQVESAYDPLAFRYESHIKPVSHKCKGQTAATERVLQKSSIGLMQVLGKTARGLGFTEKLGQLTLPAINVDLGCKLLRELFDRYSNLHEVISSYNQGSPRRLDSGELKNQSYVDKVLTAMKIFKEEENG